MGAGGYAPPSYDGGMRHLTSPVTAIVVIFGMLCGLLMVIMIRGRDSDVALFGTVLAVATNILSNLLTLAQTEQIKQHVQNITAEGSNSEL